MNPVLRLRQAFRSLSAGGERADARADSAAEEAADAVTSYTYSQRESDLRYAQMMAEMREFMSNLRNQILLGTLLIAGILGTVLSIVIALFD